MFPKPIPPSGPLPEDQRLYLFAAHFVYCLYYQDRDLGLELVLSTKSQAQLQDVSLTPVGDLLREAFGDDPQSRLLVGTAADHTGAVVIAGAEDVRGAVIVRGPSPQVNVTLLQPELEEAGWIYFVWDAAAGGWRIDLEITLNQLLLGLVRLMS